MERRQYKRRKQLKLLWLIYVLALSVLVFAGPLAAATVDELVAERAEQEYGVEMPADGHFSITLAERFNVEGTFIKEFWMDRQSGQFIANVVTEQGLTERVWGLAVLTSMVPVPTRRLAPEEIVQPSDLMMVEIPIRRLGQHAVRSPEELVGKEVRRVLVPGRPVQKHSVVPPKLILRGEKVRIVFDTGALRLTASGRAMDDAHLGQEVSVVNLSSRKAIVAVARADGLVVVEQ